MKKSILTVATVLTLVGMSFAQTPNATCNASATVLATLTIAKEVGKDLLFGNIPNGLTTTVSSTATNAAKFDIVGDSNAGIIITATSLPTDLTNGGNNLPISFTYTYSNNADLSSPTSSGALSGTGISVNLSSTKGYIGVGGTVDATTPVPLGTYNGSITLTVVYQ